MVLGFAMVGFLWNLGFRVDFPCIDCFGFDSLTALVLILVS